MYRTFRTLIVVVSSFHESLAKKDSWHAILAINYVSHKEIQWHIHVTRKSFSFTLGIWLSIINLYACKCTHTQSVLQQSVQPTLDQIRTNVTVTTKS